MSNGERRRGMGGRGRGREGRRRGRDEEDERGTSPLLPILSAAYPREDHPKHPMSSFFRYAVPGSPVTGYSPWDRLFALNSFLTIPVLVEGIQKPKTTK